LSGRKMSDAGLRTQRKSVVFAVSRSASSDYRWVVSTSTICTVGRAMSTWIGAEV
jgi:hypothetical protein